MKVHFFGTSAAVPTLRRGLPAVGFEREGELLLFDCGEGTQMALQRSPTKASRLAGVFISHMHGDHVMGLPGLLMSLQMASRTEPLVLAGTPGLQEFVTTNLRLVHVRLGYDLEFIEIREPSVVYRSEEYEVVADRLDHRVIALGFALSEYDRPGRFDLEAAEALGIPKGPLYGKLQRGEAVSLPDGRGIEPGQVVGEPRKGRKVAYVADTRPCEGSVRLAENADLLIHESTFEAGREEEAHAKGHSTVGDAVEIAKRGAARALALTHISSRYESVEPLVRQVKRQFSPSWIAEDGMVIELDREGDVLSVTGGRRRGARAGDPASAVVTGE
ncbi:MAG: ribonuclease Z [Armatimonadetes bacterium]|nr:ribonuclease Z [Armatimonadota bacterium]